MRTCAHCGKEFTPLKDNYRYCGTECVSASRARYADAEAERLKLVRAVNAACKRADYVTGEAWGTQATWLYSKNGKPLKEYSARELKAALEEVQAWTLKQERRNAADQQLQDDPPPEEMPEYYGYGHNPAWVRAQLILALEYVHGGRFKVTDDQLTDQNTGETVQATTGNLARAVSGKPLIH